MSVYDLSQESEADRRALVRIIPLLVDWQTYHNGEPFDLERAQFEFQKHARNYQIEKIKDVEERKKAREREENDLLEFCRKLGESSFSIWLSDNENNEKTVSWNDTIKDSVDGYTFGTVRDILVCAWVRPNLDPRERLQKSPYLFEIKTLFNGKSQSYWHDRPMGDILSGETPIRVEKAPFKPKREPRYVFRLQLKWIEKI